MMQRGDATAATRRLQTPIKGARQAYTGRPTGCRLPDQLLIFWGLGAAFDPSARCPENNQGTLTTCPIPWPLELANAISFEGQLATPSAICQPAPTDGRPRGHAPWLRVCPRITFVVTCIRRSQPQLNLNCVCCSIGSLRPCRKTSATRTF